MAKSFTDSAKKKEHCNLNSFVSPFKKYYSYQKRILLSVFVYVKDKLPRQIEPSHPNSSVIIYYLNAEKIFALEIILNLKEKQELYANIQNHEPV